MIIDILYIGISFWGSMALLSRRKRLSFLWPGLTLLTALAIWAQWLPPGQPAAQMAPALLVTFLLPGFLILEAAFPVLARRLDILERGPILLGLSMAVWTLIGIVAYKTRASADLALDGILAGAFLGLAGLFALRNRGENGPTVTESSPWSDAKLRPYVVLLFVVLVVLAGAVGYSSQYQRYDFDTSFHLAGYNKIAVSPVIIGGNPYLGPDHDYLIHYMANPWYLAFGLTARLSHTNVAWLYVSLAALLTPLVFFSFYSVLKVLARDVWIAVIGTLLVIGPWVTGKVLELGPGTGTFHLQFLPFPYHYTELILFPVFIACCFRYLSEMTSENCAITILLAFAAMGQHPQFLLVVPYTAGLVSFFALLFPSNSDGRLRTISLIVVIAILAAGLSYQVVSLAGKSLYNGTGYDYDPEAYINLLMKNSWILSPNLYALHPKALLTAASLLSIAGCLILTLFIAYRPEWIAGKNPGRKLSFLSFSPGPGRARWLPALAVAAVFAGPFLICYNPLVVPFLVRVLDTPVPIWRMATVYETFNLVCLFGSVAIVVAWIMRSTPTPLLTTPRRQALLIGLLILAMGCPFLVPGAHALMANIVSARPDSASILDAARNPLYRAFSQLEPGVVALPMEQAEYLLMTTPHYVVSSCRMPKERQRDNERIVNFTLPPEEMARLLEKYGVRYAVVPVNSNLIQNGDFSASTTHWDAGISCSIASVPSGQSGNCLQLTRTGYAEQTMYQNVTCDVGRHYRLTGYVKSGTSGNEPFAIEIFRHNASGLGEYRLSGTTTENWVSHSMIFEAKQRDLSVVLRKKSATPGTMLFDSISCIEVSPSGKTPFGGSDRETGGFIPDSPLQRYRAHPAMFREVLTGDKEVVFDVQPQYRAQGGKDETSGRVW